MAFDHSEHLKYLEITWKTKKSIQTEVIRWTILACNISKNFRWERSRAIVVESGWHFYPWCPAAPWQRFETEVCTRVGRSSRVSWDPRGGEKLQKGSRAPPEKKLYPFDPLSTSKRLLQNEPCTDSRVRGWRTSFFQLIWFYSLNLVFKM